jgi:hypothetical protein
MVTGARLPPTRSFSMVSVVFPTKTIGDIMDMDRRTFIKSVGLVSTWLGISVFLQACGDDDPVTPDTGNGDIAGSISANHGHSVVITAAQITAGNAVTLTLSGGGHTHSVSLTAQEVGDIGAGTRVEHLSTSDSGHTHTVTFN